MSHKIEEIVTTPYDDQKAGTSGLRKKVKVFMQKNYTENFIQSIFDALGSDLQNSTLVVGGDGRYYIRHAIRCILRIASANGVRKLIIGQKGILSTPAVSSLIRNHKTLGGIILTASHNPGGINNDFGIKYNIRTGGAAPEQFTDKVYELSKQIKLYKIVPDLDCDINTIGEHKFDINGKEFIVEVVDSTDDYVKLMKDIFDFSKLRNLIKGTDGRPPFNVLIDSMNGVTGVYVKTIFIDELGANPDIHARRIIPLDNFGEIHPDPNLTYAKDLVDELKEKEIYDLGAAFDGDGDRNMILGKKAFFVTPSDSLAILANNIQDCIPYFQKNGISGFARSMPTATAVDLVAEKYKKPLYEVPTGWKFFVNLMDANLVSLCGEESFGTGSNHIREKDGIWAVLAWLSVIEHKKMSVEDIVIEHWKEFGRNYYVRYDYEECDSGDANKMMDHLQNLIDGSELIGKKFEAEGKEFVVKAADNFYYKDPIDKSEAKKQGIRIMFEDGSRVIFRLSGTGSVGATIRYYIEYYTKDNVLGDAQVIMKPLIDVGLQISKLKDFTGRDAPTVIT